MSDKKTNKSDKDKQREPEEGSEEGDGNEVCVYCRESDDPLNMICPCKCEDAKYWHYDCLVPWIVATRDRPCTICDHGKYTDPRIERRNIANRREYYSHYRRDAYYLYEIGFLGLATIIVYFLYFILCWMYVPMEENRSVFITGGVVLTFTVLGLLASLGNEMYNFDEGFRRWAPVRDIISFRDYNGQQIETGSVWVYSVGRAIREHQRRQREVVNAMEEQQLFLEQIQLKQQQLLLQQLQQQQQQLLPIEEPQEEGDEEEHAHLE